MSSVFDLHLGGRSALEDAGVVHYLSTGNVVHFYGCDAPPPWSREVVTGSELVHHGKGGFPCREPAGMDHRSFGTWDWPLPESTLERALIEVLLDVTDEHDFRSVDKLFESAVSLRPTVVQEFLESSRSVKAKRLFCWFAERSRQTWRTMLHWTVSTPATFSTSGISCTLELWRLVYATVIELFSLGSAGNLQVPQLPSAQIAGNRPSFDLIFSFSEGIR